MATAQSMDQQIRHFIRVNAQSIIAAGEALAAGGVDAFRRVASRISDLELTASIAGAVNSSRDSFRAFVGRFEDMFDSDALKFVFGGVLSGVGGGMLAEAAGLAAALGISVLSVEVIAVALLLYGLSLTLPTLWARATRRISESFGDTPLAQ